MIINGPKFKKATLFIEAYEMDKFDFLCLSPYDWLSQLKELVFFCQTHYPVHTGILRTLLQLPCYNSAIFNEISYL